jgi:hypothetical protein
MAADNIISHAAIHEGSAPGANTDILGSDVTPKFGVSCFRVTVQVTAASVLNVMVKKTGNTTQTCALNNNIALVAGSLNTFSFGCVSGQTYNFQVEVNGQIDVLQLDEILGGVI